MPAGRCYTQQLECGECRLHVLKVGDVLQHGAVVAGEYGKPCVAGIENAASILQDNQWVEMDGASGVVRLVQGERMKHD